jgi:hypothetical protein
MGKHTEIELKKLIKGGETNTIELKVAAPRATEMAERLCGMANVEARYGHYWRESFFP